MTVNNKVDNEWPSYETVPRGASVERSWLIGIGAVFLIALVGVGWFIYDQRQQLNTIVATNQDLLTQLTQKNATDVTLPNTQTATVTPAPTPNAQVTTPVVQATAYATESQAHTDKITQLINYLRDNHRLRVLALVIDPFEGNFASITGIPFDEEGISEGMYLKFENNQWRQLPIEISDPFGASCKQLTANGVPAALYSGCATCADVTDSWQSSNYTPPTDVYTIFCP